MPKEKRVAKESYEIREDLLNLFKQKDTWNWEQIKNANSDQPEAPLKKTLLELCDKVPGTGSGNGAEFVLKATFKM